MIHYHSGRLYDKTADTAHFYKARHALVSFSEVSHLPIVADVCASFMVDNGAWQAFRRKTKLDSKAYYEFVRAWRRHPGFDCALIPDVIDGTEKENDALLAQWPVDLRDVGVPVWHLHENLHRLNLLCSKYRTVALGSSAQYLSIGTDQWWVRMTEAMEVACSKDGRPRCYLHGLRMLDPAIFSRFPFRSADSANAVINCGEVTRFGLYPAPTRAQRAAVIASRIEAFNSAPMWVCPDSLSIPPLFS